MMGRLRKLQNLPGISESLEICYKKLAYLVLKRYSYYCQYPLTFPTPTKLPIFRRNISSWSFHLLWNKKDLNVNFQFLQNMQAEWNIQNTTFKCTKLNMTSRFYMIILLPKFISVPTYLFVYLFINLLIN